MTKALNFLRGLFFFGARREHLNMPYAAIALAFLLSSCSLYKSTVRKQFEDNSPDIVTKSWPGECAHIGPIQAWIDREFPVHPSELLVSDTDLDIWKWTLSDGRILLRADRPSESGLESCTMIFASEAHWLESRLSYLNRFGVFPD